MPAYFSRIRFLSFWKVGSGSCTVLTLPNSSTVISPSRSLSNRAKASCIKHVELHNSLNTKCDKKTPLFFDSILHTFFFQITFRELFEHFAPCILYTKFLGNFLLYDFIFHERFHRIPNKINKYPNLMRRQVFLRKSIN